MTFNPSEHLMQIKNRNGSSDYLPVAWRLVWFREAFPDGTIETEMLHLDLDRETEEEGYAWNAEAKRSEKIIKRANGLCVFHATVKDGKGGIATGTKSEKAASFPDFIEKAETGSIGRALAALGYGTQFAPDLEEGQRIVDTPVSVQPAIQPVKPVSQVANAKPEEEAPYVKDLQKRCNALFGVGFWQAMVLKALKVENMDIVLKDTDLTPQDRLALKKYMDFAEAKKAS